MCLSACDRKAVNFMREWRKWKKQQGKWCAVIDCTMPKPAETHIFCEVHAYRVDL
jgi:predicted alpha/beta hydrolase